MKYDIIADFWSSCFKLRRIYVKFLSLNKFPPGLVFFLIKILLVIRSILLGASFRRVSIIYTKLIFFRWINYLYIHEFFYCPSRFSEIAEFPYITSGRRSKLHWHFPLTYKCLLVNKKLRVVSLIGGNELWTMHRGTVVRRCVEQCPSVGEDETWLPPQLPLNAVLST